MSENKDKDKAMKPGRKYFWYVFGGGVVLFVAYQFGYSAGTRSVVESIERSASQSGAAGVSPFKPGTVRSRSVSVDSDNAGQFVQPVAVQNVTAKKPVPVSQSALRQFEDVPVAGGYQVREIPGVVETAPIVPPDYSALPVIDISSPAPATSVYDRNRPMIARPSESGLMPLAPLVPESAVVYPGVPLAPRTTYKPVPDTFVVPRETKSSKDCDCGKTH